MWKPNHQVNMQMYVKKSMKFLPVQNRRSISTQSTTSNIYNLYSHVMFLRAWINWRSISTLLINVVI
uniref:Ovule protein n=1 Tax=Ascaris lumbricoides TaxID=6252 RepID=A0A0M3IR21_ASCLU